MFERLLAKFTPELSPNDRYLALSKEKREDFSKTAMNLFVRSSMSAPGSITAQAALIALYSQEMGVTDPEVLGLCLANDKERLDHLATKANNIHAVREKGPKTPVTPAEVEGIVKDDFMIAESFMDHTPEELQYIATTMYRGYLSKLTNRGGNVRIDENAYYRRALGIHIKA